MGIDKEISKNTREIALTNTERILGELSLIIEEVTSNTLEINNNPKEKIDNFILKVNHLKNELNDELII
ncbi:MAG: hypothetical protein IMZ52_02385 [Actinobacteria bacterium]|nr:hypothetical protein [Actinomycetota bacterium]MBE3114871.1 hypothetical protein [Actinomycetota bacterium]